MKKQNKREYVLTESIDEFDMTIEELEEILTRAKSKGADYISIEESHNYNRCGEFESLGYDIECYKFIEETDAEYEYRVKRELEREMKKEREEKEKQERVKQRDLKQLNGLMTKYPNYKTNGQ